ncbi:CCA tRNA nucleotidyltransferase [Nitrosophilus alvini]|uniref:CCA tRNA nucleotidyltransferase n=1 Tax=Nitrosophilus alvini TaxID=2714855 RepID=UPI0019091E34|nr:CCA tRNA nucleotidyltransferase [Nitrosophilus alvini]
MEEHEIKRWDIGSHLYELLPLRLKKELEFLKNFFDPYTHRIYLVGGAVRDLYRIYTKQVSPEEANITDIDIEVYSVEPHFFDELMKKIGAKGVGKSFFVYKFGSNIDIALPRIERKIGVGHKAFEVKLAYDEREASKRRDFCMNALMLNIYNCNLLDFWGGLDDILNRRIKIIDEEKFKEDSLRVLRGMQFAARFGYKIDKKSAEIMKKIDLDDLSKERIFWEFEKLFGAKYLHFGLYYLLCLKISEKILKISPKKYEFFKISKELAKKREKFQPHLKKFYFLYIFSKNLHRNPLFFLDRIGATNEYRKALSKQKFVPKNITDRFLVALSMLYPIRDWLGNYADEVKKRALMLGVWDRCFDGGVTPKQLIKEGYSGKELGIELRRRRLEIIRKRYKGRV